ncbi:MAG TPA: hypothetical protein VMB21_05670 [Candidatus Limnocylindria bacterium]|nr:hypothetical protein [Candidatus Limnocylindria bacterium]
MPSCQPLQRDDALACEVCGVAGAFAIADRQLCDVCYQNCGACCQGGEEADEATDTQQA